MTNLLLRKNYDKINSVKTESELVELDGIYWT